MGCPDKVDVRLLDHLEVKLHCSPVHGTAGSRMELMAVYTLDLYGLAVIVDNLTLDLNLSDTKMVLETLQFLSLAAECNLYIIQVRFFR